MKLFRTPSFFQAVLVLAVPVSLQSMLQASFGLIDQIMIGQLGSKEVAAIGLAGKFTGIFTVVIAAITAVAAIMLSQYMGQKNKAATYQSLLVSLWVCLILALVFTLTGLAFSKQIMHLYINDQTTVEMAAGYLVIVCATFFPAAIISLLSTYLRCLEKAALALYAGLISALVNTVLNWVLIFGKFGLPSLGLAGAGLATLISQLVYFLIVLILYLKYRPKAGNSIRIPFAWRQYLLMLLPLLISEFLWVLGENIYAAIYGHLGVEASAAMALTSPLQSLVIGALSGLSQAAAILVGRDLGEGNWKKADQEAKKLLLYGLESSLVFSMLIVLASYWYAGLFQVESTIRQRSIYILYAYAAIMPFKVLNMILGSGILRSGGKTALVMAIDLIGTWLFGIPLGLISAFIFHWPVAMVYFSLSLEECIRFAISLVVFKRGRWMQQLQA